MPRAHDPRHRRDRGTAVYSIKTQPSDLASVGSTVLPTVSVSPVPERFATRATPPVGGVPSPMSSVHVPLKVRPRRGGSDSRAR